MPESSEQLACEKIDARLVASGWVVQDYKAFNPSVARRVLLKPVAEVSANLQCINRLRQSILQKTFSRRL